MTVSVSSLNIFHAIYEIHKHALILLETIMNDTGFFGRGEGVKGGWGVWVAYRTHVWRLVLFHFCFLWWAQHGLGGGTAVTAVITYSTCT